METRSIGEGIIESKKNLLFFLFLIGLTDNSLFKIIITTVYAYVFILSVYIWVCTGIFTGYGKFQVDGLFSFSTLNILLCSLLACMVSEEKLDVMLIFVLLQVRFSFPLVSFRIFSLSLTFFSVKMTCLGVGFLAFILLDVL